MISANCRNLIFKTALLLAFCTAPYVQAQVTVTTSDGTSFTGALAEWNAKGLTLSLPSGEQTQLAADQLLSVQPQFATELDEPDTGRLELVDGTILPFTTYTVSDRQATVGTTLSDQPLSIPTSSIQRLQFAPLEEKVSQLWNDLADKQLTGDVLIVYKNKGASLDYLTGVLGDVSDEQLTFRWDNDEIPVKRSKVAAFSYFHSRQQEIPEPLCWAKLRTDARLPISSITYSQEELQLATSGGLKFQIPFAALDEVDYSFGKVVYLSDLQPVGVQWLPRIDLPDSAQLISQYGLPRQNQSFDGSTLSLLWPNEAKPEIRAKDSIKIYSKGLALRSRTILKYRLPPQMQRFSAIAGIDPATVAHGNVFLEISSGNKILWQGEISGAASPVEIQFDLGGVQQIGILVDYGDNLDFGDRLHLVEARVTK